MKKVRIAFIGIEHDHACFNIASVLKQRDIFEPVCFAVPEIDKSKYAEKLKVFGNLPESSVEKIISNKEIDAVMVETFELNLAKYAIIVAEHGKHIFMDKPGGADLSEFERLIKTVKEKQLVLQIGYMYRFNQAVKDLLKDVKNGKLGDIICVEAQMNCCHTIEKRRWLSSFKGGMMFFLGCHIIDIILQIQGMPKSVTPFNKCSEGKNGGYEDFTMSVLEYENGVSFAKTSSCEIGGFNRRQIVVVGTKGTVEIKPIEAYTENMPEEYLKSNIKTYTALSWDDVGTERITEPHNRYDDMTAFFGKCVLKEEKSSISYDYELKLYKVLLKCCGVE